MILTQLNEVVHDDVMNGLWPAINTPPLIGRDGFCSSISLSFLGPCSPVHLDCRVSIK